MSQEPITIKYQNIPNEQMEIILPLVKQLNPKTPTEILSERLIEMTQLNYHTMGAFIKEELIGIASYWYGTRFWCGKYVDIDNVIVDENYRGQGIAKTLIQKIEKIAKEIDCDISVLDSYTSNHQSNRFYHKLNYHVEGFHFIKDLNLETH